MPSSLATRAMLPPAAWTISTASALNSGVNFRRLLVDMTDSFRARRRNHQVSVKPGQHQVRLEPDGRERLRFIEGEVAIPPYPTWAQSDEALASVATLLRTMHDASERVDTLDLTWSPEMADPV